MTKFSGKVIRGDALGKKLGFPTANLDLTRDEVKIKSGVYSAWASLKNKKYKASFTIMEDPWKVEVHLLDYSGSDFYGENLNVEVERQVSEMEEYKTEEDLIKKIKKDIERIEFGI